MGDSRDASRAGLARARDAYDDVRRRARIRADGNAGDGDGDAVGVAGALAEAVDRLAVARAEVAALEARVRHLRSRLDSGAEASDSPEPGR